MSHSVARRVVSDSRRRNGRGYRKCENESGYKFPQHSHPRGMASAICGAALGGLENAKPDPSLKGSGIGIANSRPHHPRGRQTAKSSGRSPGLGFLLGPAFPLAQWHNGPPSPDTVAGQRRNLTDFPNTGCGLDNYSRTHRQSSGPKISVGEWAAQDVPEPWTNAGQKGPTPNLNCALADAAFMTGMERNSDIVEMSAGRA